MADEQHGRPQAELRGHGRARAVVSVGAIALGAFVLMAVGALVAALWLPETTPARIAPSPAPSDVAVSGMVYDGSHQVSVTARTAPAQALKTVADGILTQDHCVPGGTIASGSAPWWVNGQPLIALATADPPWRDLVAGVKGVDVSGLQTELARLGREVPVTGTYDKATESAVRALIVSLGGVSGGGVLPLAWVVWLPAPEVVVASCAVHRDDTLSPGTDLARLAGGLQALTLANPPGDGWTASFSGLTAPVATNGEITDAAFLAGYADTPEYQAAQSSGQGAPPVSVALANPKHVLAVPPGAVVVAGPGRGCVVAAGKVVPVDIVASSLGQTLVATRDGSAPDRVTLSPDPSVRCP